MASTKTIYQYLSDEVARTATTISVDDGTPNTDDNYLPASLVDENPAKVAKIDSTHGAWKFDFNGVKTRVDIVGLFHHTFASTATVKIQGNDTDSWGSPSLNATITIPTWYSTGTTRAWPKNPWIDLTDGVSGYTSSGYKFWRLAVTGNDQDVHLGEIWMGSQIRRLDPNINWGLKQAVDKPIVENMTAFRVRTTYSRATAIWQQEGLLEATDSLRTALKNQWFDVDGPSHPFMLVPDGLVNEAFLVHWNVNAQEIELNFLDYNPMQLKFIEAGRGLRPGV